MTRTSRLLLIGCAMAGLTSVAHAQAIGDTELLSAAAKVSTANLDRGTLVATETPSTAQVDVMSASASDGEAGVGNIVQDRSLKPVGLQANDNGIEGPDIEKASASVPDAPGGPSNDVQQDGQYEGQF